MLCVFRSTSVNSALIVCIVKMLILDNFPFLIDIIDYIINMLYHVTRTPTNGSAVSLSCDSVCIT